MGHHDRLGEVDWSQASWVGTLRDIRLDLIMEYCGPNLSPC